MKDPKKENREIVIKHAKLFYKSVVDHIKGHSCVKSIKWVTCPRDIPFDEDSFKYVDLFQPEIHIYCKCANTLTFNNSRSSEKPEKDCCKSIISDCLSLWHSYMSGFGYNKIYDTNYLSAVSRERLVGFFGINYPIVVYYGNYRTDKKEFNLSVFLGKKKKEFETSTVLEIISGGEFDLSDVEYMACYTKKDDNWYFVMLSTAPNDSFKKTDFYNYLRPPRI